MGKMSWPERVLVVSAALSLVIASTAYLVVRSRRGRQVEEIRQMDLPRLRVDVNQAEWWEIAWLPGIGEVKAKAIVAYREQYGPFRTVQDLSRVPGVGAALVERVAQFVTLGEYAASAAPGDAERSNGGWNAEDVTTDGAETEPDFMSDTF